MSNGAPPQPDERAPENKLPDGLGGRQARSGTRIQQDAERHGPDTADAIRQSAESDPADGTGDERHGGEATHGRLGDPELRLDGKDREYEQQEIHRVEHPSELRREQRTPGIPVDALHRGEFNAAGRGRAGCMGRMRGIPALHSRRMRTDFLTT